MNEVTVKTKLAVNDFLTTKSNPGERIPIALIISATRCSVRDPTRFGRGVSLKNYPLFNQGSAEPRKPNTIKPDGRPS